MEAFRDRVVVVTGGTGALGGRIVRRFLEVGATVATIDRDAEKAKRVFSDLEVGERLDAHAADLADPADVEELVAALVSRWERIDHLVNTAGGFSFDGAVEAAPLAAFDRMLEINFRTTLNVCRSVVPFMKERGSGTIVNVGSRAALAGGAEVAPYAIAKTAVLRLTESLAAEGKRSGVRVNCVLPGTLDTPANRGAMPDADPSRWVELDALADVVLFLSSPAARAIHGAAVPVFGLE
jgi:NAD(P)-dependent dehydrogenase (short-subunit alcohol dehydrogenase family)